MNLLDEKLVCGACGSPMEVEMTEYVCSTEGRAHRPVEANVVDYTIREVIQSIVKRQMPEFAETNSFHLVSLMEQRIFIDPIIKTIILDQEEALPFALKVEFHDEPG